MSATTSLPGRSQHLSLTRKGTPRKSMAGRKPLPESLRRSRNLNLRLRPGELAILTRIAERHGTNFSALARTYILRGMAADMDPADAAVVTATEATAG